MKFKAAFLIQKADRSLGQPSTWRPPLSTLSEWRARFRPNLTATVVLRLRELCHISRLDSPLLQCRHWAMSLSQRKCKARRRTELSSPWRAKILQNKAASSSSCGKTACLLADEPRRERGAKQQMIDAQPAIAPEVISKVVPKRYRCAPRDASCAARQSSRA